MHKLHHAMSLSLKHLHHFNKLAHHVSHIRHHATHGRGAPKKKLTEMEFKEQGMGAKHPLRFRM
jgi:hypothetical protein